VNAHLLQLDLAWEDPAENQRRADLALERAEVQPGDLVALPEMYATGFSLNVETTADDDGRSAAYLSELADRLDATVVGGITARGNEKARNRLLVFGPDGAELARYDKIHPFSFGREHERFEGGDAVTTFGWNGLTVCPAVCYDLRFPELFRAGLDAGAEAYVVIANWPKARRAHWRALSIARAIENQAFVLGVNRAGDDPHLSYDGGSLAIGPEGEILAELGPEPGVLSVPVEPDGLRSWRERFPAWRDRRLGR